jgi:hypothetical protein
MYLVGIRVGQQCLENAVPGGTARAEKRYRCVAGLLSLAWLDRIIARRNNDHTRDVKECEQDNRCEQNGSKSR